MPVAWDEFEAVTPKTKPVNWSDFELVPDEAAPRLLGAREMERKRVPMLPASGEASTTYGGPSKSFPGAKEGAAALLEDVRDFSPAATLGKVMHGAGRALKDIAGAYAFEAIGEPELQAKQIGITADQLKRAGLPNVEPDSGEKPLEEGIQSLPLVPKIASKAAYGLVETVPQLAAVTALSGVGVPMPLAAAGVFGSTPEGFDPKSAAIAAALPFVGKYSGEITGAIARKFGVDARTAVNAFKAAGGLTGAAGYLATIQESEIQNLPPEQRDEARIDMVANLIGQSMLGPMGVEFEKAKPALHGPLAAGRVLGTPPGAPVPRGEPSLGPETIPSSERAAAAKRMTVEATGDPLLSKRPEVPATPPQQYETALESIRKANAHTKKEIQGLFSERGLSNEEAAKLRDAAWPEEAAERIIERTSPRQPQQEQKPPTRAAEAETIPLVENLAPKPPEVAAIPKPGSPEGQSLPAEAKWAAVEHSVNQGILDTGKHPNGKKAKPSELEALRERQAQVVENFNQAKNAPATSAEPKAETPVKAAAKAKSAIENTAATEGQRPAKEVKTELVQRLEKAIEDAKSDAPNKPVWVEISIPGDGEFKIGNTPEQIQTVLDRAKGISVKSPKRGDVPTARMDTTTQGRSKRLQADADAAVKLYGSVDDAIRTVTRQKKSVVENEGNVSGVEDLIAKLWEEKVSELNKVAGKVRDLEERIQDNEQRANLPDGPLSWSAERRLSRKVDKKQAAEALPKLKQELAIAAEVRDTLDKSYNELSAEIDGTTIQGAPEAQGAVSGPGQPLAPAASVPVKPPKSQRQIITDLARGLKLPIRFGRLRTNKFAGYFLRVRDLIGSKLANDLPVVSHEVGHKLDAEFGFSRHPAIKTELNALGDPAMPGSRSSWRRGKSQAYKLGEGIAEFTRYWLTDPAQARSHAPNTHTYFESVLDANKDFGDVMRQAQEDIKVWRTAKPQARLRSHVSIGSNPNKTRYSLSQLTRDLVDDLHFARLAVDDAQKFSKTTLPPSQNFYLLARNLRGSYGMAATFLRDGVADFKTKAVTLGTSLEDALKPVAGRVSDFRDWIVAKRAQELHSQGRETGLLPSDVRDVVARFDADPAFQDAFQKIKTWNDALLQYAEDSGLMTPESILAMRRLNQDYVPFHRVFEVGAGEPSALEGAGTGRGLNVGTPGSLRRMKGSPRDIVDPLETMVKNAYALVTASEKAAITRAVAGLANMPEMGKWVEHIAAPKEQVKVGLEKLRQQLELAGADLTAVPDDLVLRFFQTSKHAPFGENTIRIIKDGKPEFYRLKSELFETFHALDLEDSSRLFQIFYKHAQLLRAGVTLAPDFALANALRDTFSAAVISKYNAFPFEVTLRGLGSMINNPKLVAEWAAAGGKSSVEATYFDRDKMQQFLKEKITKDLTPAERATIVVKSPLAALRWLTGVAEEATRIGEYQKAFAQLTKGGMPEGEARRMAAFEARDRQDFAKGGAKMKIARHAIAFFNAQLQGNVRLAQSFKDRPLQTTLKGLAYVTTAKLLEQAVNWEDQDYWDRPQWERDFFFLIPIGKGKDGHTRFLRIPTPFEVGVIFGTLPGRVMQWAKEHQKEALTTFPKTFLAQTVPKPIPQSVEMIYSDFLTGEKGWDFWRSRTIVPESLAKLPPEMQWTEQTSVTARNVGKLLGFSPLKVDHIINASTGGVGRQVVNQILDRALEAMGAGSRTAQGTMPGSRFVTTPAAVASESVEQFYKTLENLRTENQRFKHGGEPKLDLQWAPIFEAQNKLMGDLRKASRETKDAAQRAEYREMMLNVARETMKEYRKSD